MDSQVTFLAQAATTAITTVAATDGWTAAKNTLRRLVSSSNGKPFPPSSIEALDALRPHTAHELVLDILTRELQANPELEGRVRSFVSAGAWTAHAAEDSGVRLTATATGGSFVVQAGRDALVD